MANPRRLPLVDLGKQYSNLRAEIDAALDKVIASSEFILGAETAAFEDEFARFCGVNYVIACANGTDALELALSAQGVGAGDEVITVAHTFAATAEAIVRVGATPRFVDIDPVSLLMDARQVADAINQRTKAIVPVHLYGNCVDMEPLMALSRAHNLIVVEDAAQAHGATIHGKGAGAFGNAGCFSFYPGKNLGAYGDAGAIVTSDNSLAQRLRQLRDHGRTGKYQHEVIGRNSRMDALQAAVLRVKLPHLVGWNHRRRELADRYRFLLEDLPSIEIVNSPHPKESVYHLFVVQVEGRERVRSHLEESGISTGVHYPIPLHLQPAFARRSDLGQTTLPVTERAAARVLSLPLFPEMNDSDVDWVVTELSSTLAI